MFSTNGRVILDGQSQLRKQWQYDAWWDMWIQDMCINWNGVEHGMTSKWIGKYWWSYWSGYARPRKLNYWIEYHVLFAELQQLDTKIRGSLHKIITITKRSLTKLGNGKYTTLPWNFFVKMIDKNFLYEKKAWYKKRK